MNHSCPEFLSLKTGESQHWHPRLLADFTTYHPTGICVYFCQQSKSLLAVSQLPYWKLDCEESWAPKNWCFWTVVFEKTIESPLDCKEVQTVHPRRSALGVHWKDWCWNLNSSTLATSCEELTHWKRLWCWEGLGAGGAGDDRGWDGWMALPTQWTWVWVNSRSWW